MSQMIFHDISSATMPLLGELKASTNSSRSMPVFWVSICVTSSLRWSWYQLSRGWITIHGIPWFKDALGRPINVQIVYSRCILRWLWYCAWSSSFFARVEINVALDLEKLTNGTTRKSQAKKIHSKKHQCQDNLRKHRCCIGQIDKNPFCGLPTFWWRPWFVIRKSGSNWSTCWDIVGKFLYETSIQHEAFSPHESPAHVPP